jgi:hypothetical protein
MIKMNYRGVNITPNINHMKGIEGNVGEFG